MKYLKLILPLIFVAAVDFRMMRIAAIPDTTLVP